MHEYRRFVQELLDARGWTPGGFARMAGMHRQTIAKIINDERDHLGQMPDESTLQGIADGFKIDVELVRRAAARSLAGYVEPDEADDPISATQPRVVNGRNMHPGHLVTSVVLSPQERATLAGARQKLLSGADEMTDEERAVLGAFLEEEELRTLHARVDWLPRQEQLLLSTYVNDLHLQVADRSQPLGVDEDEPLADRPHPLPYEGSLPGDPDFNEGDQHVVDSTETTRASGQAIQDEEAQLSGDAEREDVALTVDEVTPAVEDVGVDSQDGQAFGQ